jgi:hypothetical protein
MLTFHPATFGEFRLDMTHAVDGETRDCHALRLGKVNIVNPDIYEGIWNIDDKRPELNGQKSWTKTHGGMEQFLRWSDQAQAAGFMTWHIQMGDMSMAHTVSNRHSTQGEPTIFDVDSMSALGRPFAFNAVCVCDAGYYGSSATCARCPAGLSSMRGSIALTDCN